MKVALFSAFPPISNSFLSLLSIINYFKTPFHEKDAVPH